MRTVCLAGTILIATICHGQVREADIQAQLSAKSLIANVTLGRSYNQPYKLNRYDRFIERPVETEVALDGKIHYRVSGNNWADLANGQPDLPNNFEVNPTDLYTDVRPGAPVSVSAIRLKKDHVELTIQPADGTPVKAKVFMPDGWQKSMPIAEAMEHVTVLVGSFDEIRARPNRSLLLAAYLVMEGQYTKPVSDYTTAISWLEHISAKFPTATEAADAEYLLAQIYADGPIDVRSNEKAVKWYEKACSFDNPNRPPDKDALAAYAALLLDGKKVTRDLPRALRLAEAAHADDLAKNIRNTLRAEEEAEQKRIADVKRKQEQLEKEAASRKSASRTPSPSSGSYEVFINDCTFTGAATIEGVKGHYTALANQGDRFASALVRLCGWGRKQDIASGITMLKTLAANGDLFALNSVIAMHARGWFVPKDVSYAYRLALLRFCVHRNMSEQQGVLAELQFKELTESLSSAARQKAEQGLPASCERDIAIQHQAQALWERDRREAQQHK